MFRNVRQLICCTPGIKPYLNARFTVPICPVIVLAEKPVCTRKDVVSTKQTIVLRFYCDLPAVILLVPAPMQWGRRIAEGGNEFLLEAGGSKTTVKQRWQDRRGDGLWVRVTESFSSVKVRGIVPEKIEFYLQICVKWEPIPIPWLQCLCS